MHNWLCSNRLRLNTNKTKHILFSPRTLNTNERLLLNNIPIIRVGQNENEKTTKFLGLNIDENLTWKRHIEILKSNISRTLFAINRSKNCLPFSALKCLYDTLVHSKLNYAIVAWGNAISVNKLFLMQKRAVRIIHKKKYRAHTDPLFRQSNILKLQDLYETQVALFMHDNIHNKLPNSFDVLFQNQNISNIITRQRNLNLFQERPRNKFTSNLPKHKFKKTWNTLSEYHKSVDSRTMFHSSLKKEKIRNYNIIEEIMCNNPLCEECHTIIR